jgi:hypothetical protein
MQRTFLSATLRNLMIFGFLSALFGCGDGKPGLFSPYGYTVGAQKVWYKVSAGVMYTVDEVEGADPKTFTVRKLKSKIYGDASADYGFDRNSVFWAGKKMDGADPATMEYLCGEYSKDKNAVYDMTTRISEDLAHLEIVGRDFIKDSRHVYFGNRVFSDDPAHFVRVGGDISGYYKDSKTCWYGIYELKGADPATLHYLGTNTAADAHRVYQEMNEIEGADIQTYQILSNGYSKDAHHVYLNSYLIEGAHPATFRILGPNYSLDDRHCYHFSNVLKDADPASFQMIDDFYSKDAQRVFCNGNPIEGADPATFRVLNASAGCSCDAHHAYSLDKRIDGADPSRFPVGEKCKSCNESGVVF